MFNQSGMQGGHVNARTGAARDAPLTAAPAWLDREAYPFQSRYLELVPERRVHYIDEGEGEIVLFVHGTPTWSFEWRHCIRVLAQSHRCIALDQLGFGLSDRPHDFAYSPEAHAEVLRTFVDRLGLSGITLVVHDYGGPIGLPLALSQPSTVRRLVLLNTWLWSLGDDPEMVRKAKLAGGRFGRFLYRSANLSLRVIMPSAYGDRRKLTRRIHEQYLAPFRDRDARVRVLWPLAHGLLASGAYYDSLWRRRERLSEIPTLIIWGMKDPAFSPALLARWRTALQQATVVELPVGHWPQEEAPEQVTRALQAFVGSADHA
jgi:haloalkane dehalogenase